MPPPTAWSCSACTYENVDGARVCEMCGTPRPGGGGPPPPTTADPFPSTAARTQPPPQLHPPQQRPAVATQQMMPFQQAMPMQQAMPFQQPSELLRVIIPQGCVAGRQFRVAAPDGTQLDCVVPPGYGPGMEIHVALPPRLSAPTVQVAGPHYAHRPAAPPSPRAPRVPWMCSQCTLENVAGASVCAACEGPGPAPPRAPRVEAPPAWDARAPRDGARAPPPSQYDHDEDELEQQMLALALAESARMAGLPVPAGPAPLGRHPSHPDASDRMLSMAQTSQAVVTAPALRVAGDSRGTASTLVGLTPEEELELAMLRSKYNTFDEPPPPGTKFPPAPPPAPPTAPMSRSDLAAPAMTKSLLPNMPKMFKSGASHAVSNGSYAAFDDSDAVSRPLSIAPLSAMSRQPPPPGADASAAATAPMSSLNLAPMSSLNLAQSLSSAAAMGVTAPLPPAPKPTPSFKPNKVGSGSLSASLLDGDELGEMHLAPLVAPLVMPPMSTYVAPAHMAPAHAAPELPTAKLISVEETWDDADRPLRLSTVPEVKGVGGSGYARLE